MAVGTKQKPKTTISHKRRTGNHQKRNEHFTKTYWPYLPIAAIVGLGFLFNNLVIQPNVLAYATNVSQSGLLSGTNSERAANGLGALALNGTLSQAAQAKAADMVARNYWSHNTPDGKEPWTFIVAAGYNYQSAGENLAYGFLTSSGAVTGWMNSPGHRANILNTSYSEVGFGYANSPNFVGSGEQTVIVAMYASPVLAAAAPAPAPAPAPKPAPAPTPAPTTPAPETAAEPTPAAEEQPIAVTKDEGDDDKAGDAVRVSATVPGETKVSQIQIATSGSAPWSLVAISFMGVILLLALVTRHSLAWHRALVKGEKFILKHKVLDIIIVSGLMIGYILSQTAGFIQ